MGIETDIWLGEEINEEEARDYANKNNMRFFMITYCDTWGIKKFENDLFAQFIKLNDDNDDNKY